VILLIEVARGLAPARGREAGLAVTRGLAARGRTAAAGLAAVFALVVARRVDELLAAAGRAALLGAGAGFAADIALAAAVSAFVAAVMALVAVFIACRAVDIVLADEVALVAAVVILVAAWLTFAAADDTVLAAAAAVGTLLAAERAGPDRAGFAAVAGRRVALLLPLPLRDPVCARFAEPPRVAVRAVRCTGIDLPPPIGDQLRETYSTVSSHLHRQAWRTGRTRS
jgi:hypothetical protein